MLGSRRDRRFRRDFSWVHTFNPGMLLTVSPFYHYNVANLHPNPNDTPQRQPTIAPPTTSACSLHFNVTFARNNFAVGLYGFKQHDNDFFNRHLPTTRTLSETLRSPIARILLAAKSPNFLDDRFNATSWLTLIAGIRPTHFAGATFPDPMVHRLLKTRSIPDLELPSEFHVLIGLFALSTAITIRPHP